MLSDEIKRQEKCKQFYFEFKSIRHFSNFYVYTYFILWTHKSKTFVWFLLIIRRYVCTSVYALFILWILINIYASHLFRSFAFYYIIIITLCD